MPESTPPTEHVTALLDLVRQGDDTALDRLFPLVYAELRRIAEATLRREQAGHTLQATALVHEAYLKLAGPSPLAAGSRAHFLGVAARAMRQVLVDHARRRVAAKRGGGSAQVTLETGIGLTTPAEDILGLDEALDRLEIHNARLRRVVELRFFAGLTEEEIADALEVTVRTVQRDWAKARAWLHQELGEGPPRNGNG